jgi:YgiT-type zinc finger domain-containing protein
VSVSNQQTLCSVCGGRLQQKKITYTQTIGDQIYIVEDVPASVCSQCGEVYLDPATVDAIQEQLEHGQATGTRQVPVYRVPQPTR